MGGGAEPAGGERPPRGALQEPVGSPGHRAGPGAEVCAGDRHLPSRTPESRPWVPYQSRRTPVLAGDRARTPRGRQGPAGRPRASPPEPGARVPTAGQHTLRLHVLTQEELSPRPGEMWPTRQDRERGARELPPCRARDRVSSPGPAAGAMLLPCQRTRRSLGPPGGHAEPGRTARALPSEDHSDRVHSKATGQTDTSQGSPRQDACPGRVGARRWPQEPRARGASPHAAHSAEGRRRRTASQQAEGLEVVPTGHT